MIRIGIGLILLLLLITLVDYNEVIRILKSLQKTWVIAAAMCIICATLLGAFNAHLLLDRKGTISRTIFLPIYWLAWAFSLITPGQIGDIATIATLLKKQGIDWYLSLGRSLLDKLISFVVMIVLAVAGIYYTSIQYINFKQFDWLYLLPILLVAGFLICLFHLILANYFSPHLSGFRGLLRQTLQEGKETIVQHPLKVIITILLSIIKMLLIGTSYWCIFRSMGTDNIDLVKTVALTATSSLVAYLPISFNGIGTVEASGIVLFSQLGMTTSMILTGYLSLRILVMLLAWLPSTLILFIWRSHSTK